MNNTRILGIVIAAAFALSCVSALSYASNSRTANYPYQSAYTTTHYTNNVPNAWLTSRTTRSVYDGEAGITSWGPHPYAANARYARNSEFTGHWDAYSGAYVDGWSHRRVNQVWMGYGSSNRIVPRSYPYTNPQVHFE